MNDALHDLVDEVRAQALKCRTFIPSQHIGPLWGVGYKDACISMADWLDAFANKLESTLQEELP